MTPIPHPQSQPAPRYAKPARPEDLLDELRGDFVLMELHITMLYGFIKRRTGLSREQVIRAIADYNEVEG